MIMEHENQFNKTDTDWGEKKQDSKRSQRSSQFDGWVNRGFDEGKYSSQSEESDYAGYRPDAQEDRSIDDVLENQVILALYRNADVDAQSIEVHVENGVVTLSGLVENDEAVFSAERCVVSLAGVEEVVNELRVG